MLSQRFEVLFTWNSSEFQKIFQKFNLIKNVQKFVIFQNFVIFVILCKDAFQNTFHIILN